MIENRPAVVNSSTRNVGIYIFFKQKKKNTRNLLKDEAIENVKRQKAKSGIVAYKLVWSFEGRSRHLIARLRPRSEMHAS